MIPTVITFLQRLNDPFYIVRIGFTYVVSYYLVSACFHYYAARPGYVGVWRRHGAVDIGSSILWCFAALTLILSLLDLLIRNELSLSYLLLYYVLFIFLFAFVYNMLEWHFPGTICDMDDGWTGEVQCITMSIQLMTGGYHTSAKPARPTAEFIAGLQALLGIMFIAVFIAKAVAALAVIHPK